MTPEQESIAEKVIQLHKDNRGIYNWQDFVETFNTTHDDRLIIARTLKDKGIIDDHVAAGTWLKDPGWTFKGFENERQNTEKQRVLNEKKDKYDLLSKKWIYKTRLLPYIVSLGALLFSIFSYFKLDKKQLDLQTMQQEIKDLKTKINRQDSLYRVVLH